MNRKQMAALHARSRSDGNRLLRAVPLLVCLALPAQAQRTFKTVGNDVKHAFGDALGVWTSPFRASGRDWLTAGAVVAAGAAISPLDDDADRWLLEHPNSALVKAAKPFTEHYGGFKWANQPTGRRILRINGALYLAGFLFDQQGLRDAGLGCLVAQQANGIVRTYVIYELIARDRPSEFTGPAREGDQYELGVPGGPWEQHSFFGGHVANAFACAAFVAERFKLGPAEAIPFAFAAGITLGRSVDRGHWISDDVIGAAFGYAVGRVVARRQLARKDARERANRGGEALVEPRLQPLIGNDAHGAYVGWELRFR